MGEKEGKTVYLLLSREILTLFSCLCSLTSLSGSFGSRFDGRVKGGSCSSKGRVKHVKEGSNGNGGEGIGWRGRRKVNEYQTACFFVFTQGLARAPRLYRPSGTPSRSQSAVRIIRLSTGCR